MALCAWPTWPMTRKCCLYIPIRKGVTIFAYANLMFNLLSLSALIILLVDYVVCLPERLPREDGRDLITLYSTNIAFMCTDAILIVILLVGVHKKSKAVLQIYFYLGVAFQLIMLCLDVILTLSFEYNELEENLVYIFFLSLNIYQLFLVYNIIHILQEDKEIQYVVYRNDYSSSNSTLKTLVY